MERTGSSAAVRDLSPLNLTLQSLEKEGRATSHGDVDLKLARSALNRVSE